MHLDHDHRKREDICFLAVCSLLVQDLRRSPSHSVAMITYGGPYGIQVLSDHSKPKIRDPRATGGICKDVRLAGCQYDGERGL